MPPQKEPKNTKKEFSWGRVSKTITFWILIVLIPVFLIQMSGAREEAAKKLDYTQFRTELARDNVKSVIVHGGTEIVGELKAPITSNNAEVRRFKVLVPGQTLSEADQNLMVEKGVRIEGQPQRQSITGFIVAFLPWLLIIGFYLFLFKQMQAGGAKAFSFGKSKAKLLTGDTPKVTFADVA
ncbi:MAG TPA: ATP-dependent metallopeptidase FtsH/Yme1/Tma family protein, partial [Gemmatimonadaceae bacterium]|nr:ATP-dependent metallopeptidase FtsH/Yme1/Tma family protein [Gemmatimonadaceae bacterium]